MNSAQLVYLGLGANLGDPLFTLQQAILDIRGIDGVVLLQVSPFYTSPAQESLPNAPHSPDYTNAVASVATTLTPHALLRVLQSIENQAGRTRPYRNAPRTLDIDVLLWFSNQDKQNIQESEKIDAIDLVIPHPRMWQRAFVVLPLHDIAPHLVKSSQLNGFLNTQTQRTFG